MSGRLKENEARLPKERYFGDSYFSKIQLNSLSNQLLLIYSLKPKKILEIGKGNGFVSNFLKSAGYDVITFDINPNLQPDIVGDITNINAYFNEGEFDLIVCCEVLEHLPFEEFEKILMMFSKISRGQAIISLPRCQKIFVSINLQIKIRRIIDKRFNIFLALLGGKKVSVNHHWEIYSTKKTSLNSIKGIINKYFKIEMCFRDKDVPQHQYLVLKA
jgi:2-polyprenyl-3-methyl-5-hydroxy-6-metoxy-1,4-benzoquinol methylase